MRTLPLLDGHQLNTLDPDLHRADLRDRDLLHWNLRRSGILVRFAKDPLHHLPHHLGFGDRPRRRPWNTAHWVQILEHAGPVRGVCRNWKMGPVPRLLVCHDERCVQFRWDREYRHGGC